MREITIKMNEEVFVLYKVLNDIYYKGKYPIDIENKIEYLILLLSKKLKYSIKYNGYDVESSEIFRKLVINKEK